MRSRSYSLKLTDGQFENARIKVQNAKLRNPDGVGMVVFIGALSCIITYQIMGSIGSCEETGQSELFTFLAYRFEGVFLSGPWTPQRRRAGLFHCYAFCEVPGFVNVVAPEHGGVIGQ